MTKLSQKAVSEEHQVLRLLQSDLDGCKPTAKGWNGVSVYLKLWGQTQEQFERPFPSPKPQFTYKILLKLRYLKSHLPTKLTQRRQMAFPRA